MHAYGLMLCFPIFMNNLILKFESSLRGATTCESVSCFRYELSVLSVLEILTKMYWRCTYMGSICWIKALLKILWCWQYVIYKICLILSNYISNSTKFSIEINSKYSGIDRSYYYLIYENQCYILYFQLYISYGASLKN